MEFERIDVLGKAIDVVDHRRHRIIVAFRRRQLQQFVRVIKTVVDAIEAFDKFGQARAFAAQILRALRVVPDVGVFQLAAYFFEAFALGRVVKDTP